MNPIARLINYLSLHRPGDKYYDLAVLMLNNIRLLVGMSIYEAADLCYTSTATVTRFVHELGFSGFVDFKLKLEHIIDDYSNSNRKMPQASNSNDIESAYMDFIKKQIDLLQSSISSETISDICRAIYDSKDIIFYCDREILDLAPIFEVSGFQLDLTMDGKSSYYFTRKEDALEHIAKEADSFVLIEIYGYKSNATNMESVFKAAKAAGGTIVLLSHGISTLSNRSDFSIDYSSTNTYFDCYILNFCINFIAMRYRQLFAD